MKERSPKFAILLFLLFFAICIGLGYAILNRYDPRTVAGIIDVATYAEMVRGGSEPELLIVTHRKLVPLVARPWFYLFEGRVGTWDPALAALLVSTSIFTAGAALLIFLLAERLGFDTATAILASTLYLLNFAVTNYFLTGLIDSAEAFLLLVLVWLLVADRWEWTPVIAAVGVTAKETFFPISIVFLVGWWFGMSASEKSRRRALCIGFFIFVGLVSVTVLMSFTAGTILTPWQFALRLHADDPAPLLQAAWNIATARGPWFVFLWLLPLGMWRLRTLPRPWLLAAGSASIAIVLMGIFDNSRGNIDRPLFSVAGAVLAISTAAFLVDLGRSPEKTGEHTAVGCK